MTRRNVLTVGALLGIASDQLLCAERSRTKMIANARFDPVGEATSAAVDSGDIPGALSMIWRDGEVCYTRVAGLRDVEKRAPLEQTTLFGIASMSKPITVAAALMLVEDGVLNLNDSITRWAPEFANMRVLRRPDGPLDDSYPAARHITIEDLMTHRSGLSYSFLARGPLAAALFSQFGTGIDSTLSPDEWLRAMAALPLAYQPGERYNYGHSIDVLGFIVGRAAGTSLRQVLHERLWGPLGMEDTDFWIPPEKRQRAATLYYSPNPGEFRQTRVAGFVGDTPPAYTSGGQGMISTAPDYLRFAQLLLGGGVVGGRRLMRADTVKAMTRNHLTDAQRRLPFIGGQPWGGLGFGFGMPVVLGPNREWGGADVGSYGWGGAFGGWWQADPSRNAILLWLQSCLPAPPIPGKPLSARVPGATGTAKFLQAACAALS